MPRVVLNELACNEWSDTDTGHECQVVESGSRATLVDKPSNLCECPLRDAGELDWLVLTICLRWTLALGLP